MTLSHLKNLAPMLIAVAILVAMALFVVFAPSPSKPVHSTVQTNTSTTLSTKSMITVASVSSAVMPSQTKVSSLTGARPLFAKLVAARVRRLMELGFLMQILRLVSEHHKVDSLDIMESLVLTLPRFSLPMAVPIAEIESAYLKIKSSPVFLTREQLRRALAEHVCSVLELPTQGYTDIDLFVNRSSPSEIHEKVVLRYLISVSTVYLDEVVNDSRTLLTTFVAPIGIKVGALFVSKTIRWAYMEFGGVKTTTLIDYTKNSLTVIRGSSVETVEGVPTVLKAIASSVRVLNASLRGREAVVNLSISVDTVYGSDHIGMHAVMSVYFREVVPGLYVSTKTVYSSVVAYVKRGSAMLYCLKLVHPYAATNTIESVG